MEQSTSKTPVQQVDKVNLVTDYFKGKMKHTWQVMKRKRICYLFIAPFCILFFIFTLLPVLMSIGLSFTYYNILESPIFIGWQNYINLFFSDEIFLKAVKNTFIFALITGPISYFAAFFFAWLINELTPKVRAFMTLIFYAPTISGQAYVIWRYFFASDMYGLVNGFLMRIGVINEPILWFENTTYIKPVLIIIVLWMSLGAGFLSFVAGLQNIDYSLYEAGYVDGISNRWQELWYITLPAMKPQLMFGAVMTITGSFSIHDQLAALAGFPSVDYEAHTVVSHLVDYGTIRYEMGYASAIATLLFLVMVISNKLVQALLRKVGT